MAGREDGTGEEGPWDHWPVADTDKLTSVSSATVLRVPWSPKPELLTEASLKQGSAILGATDKVPILVSHIISWVVVFHYLGAQLRAGSLMYQHYLQVSSLANGD